MKRFLFVCIWLAFAWACSAAGQDRIRYEGKTIQDWKELVGDDYVRGMYTYFSPLAADEIPSLLKLLNSDWMADPEKRNGSTRTSNYMSQTGKLAAHALASIGPQAIPSLQRALTSEYPRVRAGAALALGWMRPGPTGALPALRTALKDRDEQVRLFAALAIHRIEGKTEALIPVLIDTLRCRTPELRRQAAEELTALGPTAKVAIPALIDALRDEELLETKKLMYGHSTFIEWPLSRAATALVAIGPEAADALQKAVADREPLVRSHALLALGTLPVPSRETLALLRKALADKEAEVRLIAAIHLWRFTGEADAVVPVLLNILKQRDVDLWMAAAITLGRVGKPARQAIPLLLEQLTNETKRDAAQIALRMFESDLVPAAVQAMADLGVAEDDTPQRKRAEQTVKLLSPIKPSFVPGLLKALESSNVHVRSKAAEQLASWGSHGPRVVAALREASSDIDVRVRFHALVGLARFDILGPPDSVARALADLLKQKKFPQRKEAANALLIMAYRARAALPVLREVIKEPESKVRDDVERLLKLLEPENRDLLALNRLIVKPFSLLAAQIKSKVEPTKNRTDAVRELGLLIKTKQEALPLLITTLKDEDSSVVKAVVEVLANHAGENVRVREAIVGLEARLEKLEPYAQEAVFTSLRQAGSEGLAMLRRMLKNPKYRDTALKVVRKIGNQGKPLLPTLEALLDEKDPAFQENVIEAILLLGGRAGTCLKTMGELLECPDIDLRRSVAILLGKLVMIDHSVAPLLAQGLRNSDRFAPPMLPAGFTGQFGAFGHSQSGLSGPFVGAIGGVRALPSPVRSLAAVGLMEAGPAARYAIPELSQVVVSEDVADRILASTLLGAIGPRAKSAVPILRKMLQDQDVMARAAAANALSKLDRTATEAIPVFIESLREEMRSQGVTGPHVEGLIRFGKPAIPSLIELLKDRASVQRLTCPLGLLPCLEPELLAGQIIHALGEIGPEASEAIPLLLQVIQEKTTAEVRDFGAYIRLRLSQVEVELRQPAVRLLAIRALARLGPKARTTSAVILERARDPLEELELRHAAVEAFWRMERNAEPLIPVLRELFWSDKGLMRADFDLLSEMGSKIRDLIPFLIHKLDHPLFEYPGASAVEDHIWATRVLGKLGTVAKLAVAKLREGLRSSSWRLRAESAVALWRIEGKTEGVLPILLATVREVTPQHFPDYLHEAEEQRAQLSLESVVSALGEIGKESQDAVPHLHVLLGVGNLSTRLLVAEALWRIDGDTKVVLPVLKAGLESGDSPIRRKSAEALGVMGIAARSMVDALKELLDDGERDVRAAAGAALTKINQQK